MNDADWMRDRLVSWRNADGGWAYAPGKRSRLEPTCLGLLATGDDSTGSILGRWPPSAGLFTDGEGLPVNYAFNGLALLVLLGTASASLDRADAITRRLLQVKGIALEPSEVQRLDTRLQAWPWLEETFSWVEPTAWCLLALKKWRHVRRTSDADARIEEAERLLVDRSCEAGGWNYGNAIVFRKALPPYVPTTALALLALQDRRRDPVVMKSLDLLGREAASEPSAVSIATAMIALHVLGGPVGPLAPVLLDRARIASELGQVIGVATALYAMHRLEHDCAPFRV